MSLICGRYKESQKLGKKACNVKKTAVDKRPKHKHQSTKVDKNKIVLQLNDFA
jgi:hypothetical protein